MIHLAVRKMSPEYVNLCREWTTRLNEPRREEALKMLAGEGCAYERALPIEAAEGPVIVERWESRTSSDP